MSQAYTPGLQVKERTRYRALRLLPIAGTVLKAAGDPVQAEETVARSEQPGEITPVNLANLLGAAPGEIPRLMQRPVGSAIEEGDLLAQSRGIFGFFKSEALAPVAGVIESVSSVTGQLILRGAPVPVEVKAFASGVVTEVIPGEGVVVESNATFLQGIFGIGGEAYGPLKVLSTTPEEPFGPEQLDESHRGCIVVTGSRIPGEAIRRAVELGVAAVVGGGIDDQDLRDILGYDLGVAITGTEQIGTTVIITEGFGSIAMADRAFALLKSREGAPAAVTGATQIRAGVMRPEIVIPWPEQSVEVADAAPRVGGGVLVVGSRVRMIRDPYFGLLGEVAALPSEPQLLGTGSKARVLEVVCRDGQRITVPRANVEIIGA